nr:hypothetical protein [Tanacetum cinerariifolium]
THEVVKGRLAKTPLKEPGKSKETLHKLRASLSIRLANKVILPLQTLLLSSREKLQSSLECILTTHDIKDLLHNPTVQNWYGTPRESLRESGEAKSARHSERPLKGRRRTMDMTIDQQVALDEALVPHARRLMIGRSNFHLLPNISSKESTLQLVGAIRRLIDVNINKLHQPWRSFVAIINKCLRGKSSGYDSLRLSQAQFLWGFYHKRNVDFAYLLWEDFVYQVEHKDTKKRNEMYYPRFTKNTQQFSAMLPIELTNTDIKNSKAYKEYYAVATGATPPKTKASVRKTKSNDDEEGDDDDQEKGSDDEQASDEEDKEFIHPSLSTHGEEEMRDEESFDPIPKTPENTDVEGNGEDNLGLNVGSMLNPTPDAGIESIFKTTSQMDVQSPTTVAPLHVSAPTLTPSTIATITTVQQAPTPSTTAPRTLLQNLPNFGSLFGFDHRLKTLEDNFSEFVQTNQFAGAVSSIPGIVQRYMDQRMNETVKVKVQVSKILPKIEQTVNEQLEAEVLTRSSNSSKTSYAAVADLSEMKLKKILIEKIESNKSIQRSNEQRNIYKALVEAYESDKIILDTYGDTVMLKRRHDDDVDKDEEPFAGSDRGSKRRKKEKEPESASAPKEKPTRSVGKSTQGSKSRQMSASKSATAEEPMQTTHEMEEPSHLEFETGADDQPIAEPSQHPEWFSQQKKPPTPDRDWNKTLPATHENIQPWISELAKQTDSRSSLNELMDTPVDFSAFLMNRIKVDTLIPELLAGPTYELMKGGASSRKYTTFVTKTKEADYGHIKWIEDLFYGFAVNRESAHDVYSKRRIIVVTELKIVEWHNYKNLDWITVRRDDDKLYKFKEGDFKRLRIYDIEDMLLLLVQGKLTNLTVEERFAFSVSLRMFTRSIVIQRRVEDLQLGIKSYQKKLNLTRPDTYRSDLKRKEAYIAYSNPRGFIY